MLEYGKMYKCDRCSLTYFMKRDGVTYDGDPGKGQLVETYSADMPDNWAVTCRGWHLCPHCAQLYNTALDVFHKPSIYEPK